ncbi:MAG TPA: hypothetical protein VNA14_01565 [Mycobacteriales bacterium]|nr:hypothetical protein [Mycobacteriales bacterium]
MLAIVVLEGVVIALLGVLVAGLLRSHADILRRLHDLGIGLEEPTAGPAGLPNPTLLQGAHDVVGETLDGEAAAVAVVSTGADTLLAFLSSGCATCERLFRDEPVLPARTRLVVVAKGPEEESTSALRELVRTGQTAVMSSQAWLDYGVPHSPYFVLVDGSRGRVRGEGAATSWRQVAGLITQALADATDGGRRESRADAELLAAGITPGHKSLYE